ncbi:MAG: hypothetical protein HOY78_02560 [Saccharothrix sp.]|nr:hypothetical protein [Saccharothrix sp.]
MDLLAEYEYLMTQPGFRVKADVAARLKLKPATLGRAIVRGRAYRKQAVETAGRAVVMIRYLVDAVTVLGLTAWWRLVQLVTGRDAAPSGS